MFYFVNAFSSAVSDVISRILKALKSKASKPEPANPPTAVTTMNAAAPQLPVPLLNFLGILARGASTPMPLAISAKPFAPAGTYYAFLIFLLNTVCFSSTVSQCVPKRSRSNTRTLKRALSASIITGCHLRTLTFPRSISKLREVLILAWLL